MTQFHQFFFF
ncbi:KtrB protein, partial [Vibrio parahaemolyticus]